MGTDKLPLRKAGVRCQTVITTQEQFYNYCFSLTLQEQPCGTGPSLRDSCLKREEGREGNQGSPLIDAPLASRARPISYSLLVSHHDIMIYSVQPVA